MTRPSPTSVLLVAGGVLGGALAVLASWPVREVGHWLPDLLVGWAFLGSGFVVAARPGGRRQGVLIAAVGVAWFIPDVLNVSPLLYRGVLVQAALAMPRGTVGSWGARCVVATAYLTSIVTALALQAPTTLALGALVVAVAATGPGVRRLAGFGVGGVLTVGAAAHLVAPRASDEALLLLVELLLMALALMLCILHGASMRRSDVTDLVVELGSADALADFAKRDPAARDDPAFLAAWAAADRILKAHAALDEELGLRITETDASRRRLVMAEESERAALERWLQKGPAGRLDRMTAELSGVTSDEPEAADSLRHAREIAAALRIDLTRIARGLHPAAVDDGSLESALHAIAGSSPLPVVLDLRVGSVAPVVAPTVYFVCAELVANAVRHSGATRVDIHVRRELMKAPWIVVEVVDDGRGGADSAGGTGLLRLADRVAMAGGSLTVDSVPARGTHVTARLPEPYTEVSAGG